MNSAEQFRPMSRKGTALSNSDSAMSATSGRVGTASRLSAMTNYRIGTSKNIGIPQKGTINAERPLTQQGLSGISTASGSNFRQVKDKRYWIAMLQTKIQEIINETEKLNKEKKNLDRETSAKKLYEKKVKEQAKDLSTLHSRLSDLNLALNSNSTSGASRQQLHNETLAFREKNETMQNQLESTFRDRQSREMQNGHLEETIASEKHKMNEMIYSLSVDEQNKYRELQIICENLKDENVVVYGKIEETLKQKEKLNGIVMNSQSRSEAVKLQSKLREMMTKRNQLKEEEINRLSPAQEREKLISEVRINNQSISAINKQLKIISEQLDEKRSELAQLEQDLEEGSSERFTKFKELKKRDEMMESFQQSFPDQMRREKQNVDALKNQITFAIEQITLQGMSSKIDGNTRISTSILNENSQNSHEGLVKEYGKLQIQLKQLKILEKRIKKQLDDLKSEEVFVLENIQKFNNLNALRDEYASKYEEIGNSLQDLKDKKRVTENVVKDSEKRNQSIKENLRSNETYRQISHMEEKLSDLIKDNKALEANLKELNKEFNVTEVKSVAQSKLNDYNRLLCDDFRSMTKF